ncbi:NAD-dependent nucleoside-diphosphate sugar epimerase [Bryobacterales bacterium F-183]|nr:NAD-dependent nucleoside-diphosphate sugar epimerase [Bryobacterales bacterium F-183]
MKIVLTGASGFIGVPLVEKLLAARHDLVILGRRQPKTGAPGKFYRWDSEKDPVPVEAVDGAGAIIHMAGEPVSQRWNDEVKRKIRDSRVIGTRSLVQAIAQAQNKPRVLVSGSAIGYYGNRGNEELDEASKPGSGFLPQVTIDWEHEARQAERLGVRTCLLRTGIVLHHSGGALKSMIPPFKMCVGGPLGDGSQWMSWIHRDDLVDMTIWAMQTEAASGPVNGVAPEPCTGKEFATALGAALSRPAILPTPTFAIRLLFGEMSQIVLASQKVLPRVPMAEGFSFRYPKLTPAMRAAV